MGYKSYKGKELGSDGTNLLFNGRPVMSSGPMGYAGVVGKGKTFYVNSAIDATDGTSPETALGTLDEAFSLVTASQGDCVVVMPGHAETISTAGGVTMDVVGVTTIFLGEGAKRPTFTFSNTAATIAVSAASNRWIGRPILVPSVDSVVSPIVVSAADCSIVAEAKDASSTVEFVRAILTTAAADRLDIDLVYRGDTGGNAVVNAVRLVGGNNVNINLHAFGIFSTAAVEFLTTACTNVVVKGYIYNSGTTDGSKNVVDTVTGSTWWADIEDGAAGSKFSGGSAAALAADDMTAITNALYGTAGIASWAAAAAPGNNVSIAEALRYQVETGTLVPSADAVTNTSSRDVVGNKTDAAAAGDVSTTESLMAYAKQSVMDNFALPRCVEKADGAVLSGADDLFTITGGPIKVLEITGIVTTAIGAGTTNAKLQITTTEPAATVDMNAGAVDIDADAAGTSYQTINTTGVFTPVTAGYVKEANSFATLPTTFLCPIGTIKFTSDAARSGNIKWYLRYVPLSQNSRVVAAA